MDFQAKCVLPKNQSSMSAF
uniref:Uncharacterized protein n=1 Tax=Anguilla anguilla TaxID=7936 RepID=A0A0E9RM13_ANGAN